VSNNKLLLESYKQSTRTGCGLGDSIMKDSKSTLRIAGAVSQITDLALLPKYLTHDDMLVRNVAMNRFIILTEDDNIE